MKNLKVLFTCFYHDIVALLSLVSAIIFFLLYLNGITSMFYFFLGFLLLSPVSTLLVFYFYKRYLNGKGGGDFGYYSVIARDVVFKIRRGA